MAFCCHVGHIVPPNLIYLRTQTTWATTSSHSTCRNCIIFLLLLPFCNSFFETRRDRAYHVGIEKEHDFTVGLGLKFYNFGKTLFAISYLYSPFHVALCGSNQPVCHFRSIQACSRKSSDQLAECNNHPGQVPRTDDFARRIRFQLSNTGQKKSR